VYVRLIAFLLALAVTAGMVCPAVAASADVVGLVDDGAPDPDPAIAATPLVLAVPVRCELEHVAFAPAESPGRLHRAWVFRPPRRVASR
jgi:hypothetical protein